MDFRALGNIGRSETLRENCSMHFDLISSQASVGDVTLSELERRFLHQFDLVHYMPHDKCFIKLLDTFGRLPNRF